MHAARNFRPSKALCSHALLFLVDLAVPERRSRKKVCWALTVEREHATRGQPLRPSPLASVAPARWSAAKPARSGHEAFRVPCDPGSGPDLSCKSRVVGCLTFRFGTNNPAPGCACSFFSQASAQGSQAGAHATSQAARSAAVDARNQHPFAPPPSEPGWPGWSGFHHCVFSVVWLGPLFCDPHPPLHQSCFLSSPSHSSYLSPQASGPSVALYSLISPDLGTHSLFLNDISPTLILSTTHPLVSVSPSLSISPPTSIATPPTTRTVLLDAHDHLRFDTSLV